MGQRRWASGNAASQFKRIVIRAEFLGLHFSSNPPERMVGLVQQRQRLAQSGEIGKLARILSGADFVFRNELDRSV